MPERVADIHWVAGFLEGEGSFALNKRRGKSSTPLVKATQTDMECLLRLQALFGGSVCSDDRTKPGRDKDGYTRKPQYEWRIGGTRAIVLMQRLLPYMSTRRQEQIERVLEYVKEA